MENEIKNIVKNIEKFWFYEGHLNENQRNFLVEKLLELKPKKCLETGFASGRSAVSILCTANPDLLVSVDINLDYIGGARQHADFLKKEFPNFTVIEGNSKNVLNDDFFQNNFEDGVDFCFIDGDHTYEGAKNDIQKIYKYLAPNALMIIDDYYSCGPDGCSIPDVDRAVDDFCKENQITPEKWHNNGKGFAIVRKQNYV